MKNRFKALILTLALLLASLPFVSCGFLGDPMLDDLYSRDIFPGSDNTYDVGSNSTRYAEGHFNLLYIDGTLYVAGGGGNITDHGDLTGLGDNDHSQYILESVFNNKGDILTATGDDTPSILGVGANDLVLTADSAQTNGLKWATVTAGAHDLGGASHNADNLTDLNSKISDATLVDSSDMVLKTLYDAQTLLRAITDDTPATLTVNEQNVVGRLTGGNIDAIAIGISNDNIVQMDDADAANLDYAKFTTAGLAGRSYAEVLSDLSGQASAEFLFNTQQVGGVVDPTTNQQVATKKYVDDNDHTEAHTIASHSDTTATGAELETLTDGSETALHSHAGGGAGLTYTELDGSDTTTAAGQGAGDGAWATWDLSAIVPNDTVTVEIAIQKLIATDDCGARENGSGLVREFNLLKLQWFTITVNCDGSQVIEIMSDDVSDADVFSVMGYWN